MFPPLFPVWICFSTCARDSRHPFPRAARSSREGGGGEGRVRRNSITRVSSVYTRTPCAVAECRVCSENEVDLRNRLPRNDVQCTVAVEQTYRPAVCRWRTFCALRTRARTVQRNDSDKIVYTSDRERRVIFLTREMRPYNETTTHARTCYASSVMRVFAV